MKAPECEAAGCTADHPIDRNALGPRSQVKFTRKRHIWIASLIVVTTLGAATRAIADTATIRVTIARAGFMLSAGGGKGVITFHQRPHPFTVQGLTLDLASGSTIRELVGRVSNMNSLNDFPGTYSITAADRSLHGIQLKNSNGVIITLQNRSDTPEAFSNFARVVITLGKQVPD